MTIPIMPTGLRPVVSAYGFDGPEGVMRTPVAGGRPRYGLEFDRGVQPFRVTMILTPLELSVWSAFFHHVIKKGATSFSMHLDSGFGTDLHTVNIVPGTYSANRTQGGVHTAVSFVVEAESQAYVLTYDEAVILVDLWEEYGDASSALLAELAAFATIHTLVLAP